MPRLCAKLLPVPSGKNVENRLASGELADHFVMVPSPPATTTTSGHLLDRAPHRLSQQFVRFDQICFTNVHAVLR